MHQPGEQWMYNTGSQVLGVVLERAAGVPLEKLLRDRILDPLAMHDTGFSVPPTKRDRLTTAYRPDPASGAPRVADGNEGSYWSEPPAFPSAASWLVSTIDDYWAFVQMMLAHGEYHGTRIISPASVALMTTDHLTPEQRAANPVLLGANGGWGLGMATPAGGAPDAAAGAVTAGARHPDAAPRGFGWDGGSGTTWRTDVENDLTGILFTQRELTSPEPPEIFVDFWDCAYGAIED